MRVKLVAAVMAISATSAVAEVGDDFALASHIFGQVSPGPITERLDGEWLHLSALANLQGGEADPDLIADLVGRFCGNDPSRGNAVNVSGDASFTMDVARSTSVRFRYDWLGGAEFSRTFDPDQLTSMLGIDNLPESEVERAQALARVDRVVAVYRVSEDVLVIASSRAADIYGRCPP